MKTMHIKPNKKLVSTYNTNNPPREAIAFIQNRQGFTWSIITMLSLACCCFAFLSGRVAVAESTTFTINNNNAVLELTIPSSISLELNPTSGTDYDTVNLPIGIGTNNQYGYTLSMNISSSTLTRTSDVLDGSGNTITPTPTINSITTSFSPSSFESSNDTINTWGYKLATNTNYLPIPTSTTPLRVTTSPSNSTNITTGTGDINLNFAAKVDTTTPAGTYQATINFTAVTNAVAPLLYDLVAMMDRGTQTASDLQQPITVANSGVYEYDPTIFGIASDASNDYTIYYYRGILDSAFASTDGNGNIGSSGNGGYYPNYVRLGNTCWRIVRTTGSGGVKMIYNGLYSAGTVVNNCANSADDAQVSKRSFNNAPNASPKNIISVGYTLNGSQSNAADGTLYETLFGTNENYSSNGNNSLIKQYIENTWFTSANGIGIYNNILETSAGFCNDRTAYNDSGNVIENNTGIVTPYTPAYSDVTIYYFGARMRNINSSQSPSLSCPRNKADLYTTTDSATGNQQLYRPVGLLTADEASFAGSGSVSASQGSGYNASSYLRSGSNFWLLSPALRYDNGYAHEFNLYEKGDLGMNGVSVLYGVRPVISLVHDTAPVSGSGTATDPWLVSAP